MILKLENFRIRNIRIWWNRWMHPEVNIALDFGTAHTLLCVVDKDGNPKGKILDEPTVALTRPEEREIISTGQDAKLQVGRDSAEQKTLLPVVNGVIQNFDLAVAMLRRHYRTLFEEHNLSRRTTINLIVAVPIRLTPVEERSVADVAIRAGGKINRRTNCVQKVLIIDQPVAAAIGSGFYSSSARYGQMFIDIGGGTTQVAIIAGTGTVSSALIRGGGTSYTAAFQKFLKTNYEISVDDNRAEDAKFAIGTAMSDPADQKFIEVAGRHAVKGYGMSVEVLRSAVAKAFESVLFTLTDKIAEVCEAAPVAVAGDLADHAIDSGGIILTGGGTELDGLRLYLERETGMRVQKVQNPFESVLLGAARTIANDDLRKRFTKEPIKTESQEEKKRKAKDRHKDDKRPISALAAALH